eukprot:Macronucleus_5108.p1 GENE.Macronucleus_5108~~Macronucleus_5108.p1  ORF type:complete len:178 (+),score=41.81 Macronucleus_5108:1-534(+)
MLAQQEAAQVSEEEQAHLAQVGKPQYIKQIVANACGTMALLHALANVTDLCADGENGNYREGTFLHRLVSLYKDEGKTPEQLGEFLNEDEELERVHNMFATSGQSNMDENTRFHFVAYVNLAGTIWELDGRRSAPLQKGDCTNETFGIKIAELLQGYVQMDNTCAFSLMALAPDMGQ